jgi:hypothetical protein
MSRTFTVALTDAEGKVIVSTRHDDAGDAARAFHQMGMGTGGFSIGQGSSLRRLLLSAWLEGRTSIEVLTDDFQHTITVTINE